MRIDMAVLNLRYWLERYAALLIVLFVCGYVALTSLPMRIPAPFVRSNVVIDVNGSLDIISNSLLLSEEGPAAFNGSAFQEGEFSVEFAITPKRKDLKGPARIAAYSFDTQSQNWLIGQDGRALVIRLQGREVKFEKVLIRGNSEHFVVVFKQDGVRLFGSGKLLDHRPWQRQSYPWVANSRFSIGNEVTGDRPWLGKIHLFRLYDIQLSDLEANRLHKNYLTGRTEPTSFADLVVGNEGNIYLEQRDGSVIPITVFDWPGIFKLKHTSISSYYNKTFNLKDVALNYLATVPLGFFLAALLLSRGIGLTLLISVSAQLVLSAFAESVQFFSLVRVASIMDIVLNVAGVVTGVLIWQIIIRGYKPFHQDNV